MIDGGAGEMDDDALDAYMQGLGAKEAKAATRRMKKELGQIELELVDLEKILVFLKPALGPTLDGESTAGEAPAAAPQTPAQEAARPPPAKDAPPQKTSKNAGHATDGAASVPRSSDEGRTEGEADNGPASAAKEAKAKRQAEVERLMADDGDSATQSKPVTAAERIARLKNVTKEVAEADAAQKRGAEPEAKRLKVCEEGMVAVVDSCVCVSGSQ